ncbi:MAG: PDZ domain-containing protein [Planctomycetota bacterium]
MNRNPILIAGVALAIGCMVDIQDVSGQGIFQRLRGRIQARRMQTPPPQPNPASQASPRTRPVTPTQSSSSLSGNGGSGAYGPAGSADNRDSLYGPMQSSSMRSNRPDLERSGLAPQNGDANSDALGDSILGRTNPAGTSNRLRPSLGINVVEDKTEGVVMVESLRDDSPARRLDIRKGDLILAINGVAVQTIADASRQLVGARVGQRMTLIIRREDRIRSVDVPLIGLPVDEVGRAPLGEQPSVGQTGSGQPKVGQTGSGQPSVDRIGIGQPSVDRIGIEVADLPGVRGSQISTLAPTSPAAAAGLQVGDRIVAVNGRLIRDSATLQDLLPRLPDGTPVAIRIIRGSQILQPAVTPSRRDTWQAAVDAQAAETSDDPPSRSVASDIGSMLGGLFGGGAKNPPAATNAAKQATGGEELLPSPQPVAAPTNRNRNGNANTGNETLDEMALEDEMALKDDLTFEAPRVQRDVPEAKRDDSPKD